MSNEEALLLELDSLPKGYISKKHIHGDTYFYLQQNINGKLVSRYIPKNELEDIREKIKRRKTLEEKLKSCQRLGKKQPIISKLGRELTGFLMSSNTKVAEFSKGILINKNDRLCPLYIKRNGDLSTYLASRVIDSSRTNARLLKKALRISEPNDVFVALYSHGAVLTDDYWFKSKHSKTKYSDVAFTNDLYNEIALNGDLSLFPVSPRYSPQLSLIGSFEKCWKKENGIWWLYKKETEKEIFSELFASEIALCLGLPTVSYVYEDGFIKSKNFASDLNFEPMTSIAGDDDNYAHVFNSLLPFGKEMTKSYLRLIWFDSLVNNVDRHNENCGLLRDRNNGSVIGLAPNFDNNLSLIARNSALINNPKKDGFIKFFVDFVKNNEEAKKEIKEIAFPPVTEELCKEVLKKMPFRIPNEDEVVSYVVGRGEYLAFFIGNL